MLLLFPLSNDEWVNALNTLDAACQLPIIYGNTYQCNHAVTVASLPRPLQKCYRRLYAILHHKKYSRPVKLQKMFCQLHKMYFEWEHIKLSDTSEFRKEFDKGVNRDLRAHLYISKGLLDAWWLMFEICVSRLWRVL